MVLPNVFVFVLLVRCIATTFCCPHEDKTLKKFSEVYSGYDKQSDIVITDGILLDITLLDVNTVEITGTGSLVFNQGHDITVKVKGIYVRDSASLIIGSELCRHGDNVNIVLQGTRTADRSQLTGAGEKYIVATDQATLHIYGEDKVAWTKLTQTIPAAAYAGDHLYWHKVSEDKNTKTWMNGLSVYIFNSALNKKFYQPVDFGRKTAADDEQKAAAMMSQLNDVVVDGDLVAISVQRYFSPKPDTNLAVLYDTLEQMAGMEPGSLLLRSTEQYDAFSLVFVKGGSFTQDHSASFFHQYPGHAMASLEYQGNKVTAEWLVYYQKTFMGSIDLRILSPEVGYPEIRLAHDIASWKAGDKLLITSTDYDRSHGEVRTIREVTGPYSLRLSGELRYRHFGEIESGVDMRAEVALLSRNVKIEGEVSRDCPPSNGNCDKVPFDSYGGHIKIINNFTSVVIDGAELEHMGQATDNGFYPIHFHMCLDVTGRRALVRRNSIHDTSARAVTVHGTYGTSPSQPGVQVVENVAYRIHGHAYFLEDGIERATLFIGNLVSDVFNIDGDFVTDVKEASGFWITTPQAVVIGNVAAGAEGWGFWYVFPDEPVGASTGLVYQKDEVWRTPIWTCDRNVAHSNVKGGMFFDHILVDAMGRTTTGSKYAPVKDPLDPSSEPTKAQIVRLTAYKNKRINTWLRGRRIEMMQYSSAESRKGIQLANQAQALRKSIFMGRSTGNGEDVDYPDTPDMLHYLGLILYDGRHTFESSLFTNFAHGPNKTYVSGAIGFNPQNKFGSAGSTSVKDLRFSFDDYSQGNRVFDGTIDDEEFGFGNKNGDESATFRDWDGSVTSCPGDITAGERPVTVVKPEKFTLTENCTYRENWQMAICEGLYGKIEFYTKAVFRMPFSVSGQTRRVRYDDPASTAYEDHDGMEDKASTQYMAVLGDSEYYYEYQYVSDFPKRMEMRVRGIERDYPVVVGVCLPENTTRDDIILYANGPDVYWKEDDFIEVSSLQELSTDTYMNRYYMSGRMFYMKLQTRLARAQDWDTFDTTDCPNNYCPGASIQLKSQRPYTPCFSPTQEELSTDVYLDDVPRDDCQYPGTEPEADWGAGDTTITSHDGTWGEWSGWAECCNTANAAAVITTRYRLCDNPPKLGSGKDCKGSDQDTGPCQVDCPVDGVFSEWSSWSDCTCDGRAAGSGGVTARTRECVGTANGGEYCNGSFEYYTSCSGDCENR